MPETAPEVVWGVHGRSLGRQGGDLHPWRTKTRLGAAAAQYNTSGAVDEATLNSITTEQVRKNMRTCNTPGCDSCWHM